MKQKLIELTEKRILREMYEDEKALKNMLSMETARARRTTGRIVGKNTTTFRQSCYKSG